ncbi:shikimate dehydrogenase [Chloroflexota bacterium]|nr:shikimate dehydrogenase [Chloroflexota bacterium]
MITSKTKKLGLICWPVGHSLSPIMHNTVFESLGMDWVYLPLGTRPGELEAAVKGLKALSFEGCNVSVPYKTEVIQYLDEVEDTAMKMNAVNTIKNIDGKLIGMNTDAPGFIQHLTSEGLEPDRFNILMIGGGGAARAALFGLSQFDIQHITVMDTVESQAASLIHDLGSVYSPDKVEYLPPSEENFRNLSLNGLDLVVNATPVGMSPKVDTTPWPDGVDLPDGAAFFDIVYNPQMTKFLSRAKTEGHKTISGLGMLVYQGAICFESWTGVKPTVDLMFEVCQNSLK